MDIIQKAITALEIFDSLLPFIIGFIAVIMIYSLINGALGIINNLRLANIKREFKSNVRIMDYIESNNKKEFFYNDVDAKKLDILHIKDINALKDYFYKMFINFENAYNNLDLEQMQFLSTPELFDNYELRIKLEKERGYKRVIGDFDKRLVKLYHVSQNNSYQTVEMMIEISYVDYTMEKHGYLYSGQRYGKITEAFEVTFINYLNDDEITKCPTCGAPVSGSKCEWCRSTLKNTSFKIKNIKKIIHN